MTEILLPGSGDNSSNSPADPLAAQRAMIEQFRRAVLDTGDIVAAIGTAVDSVAAEAYRADMAQKALGQARVDAMGYAPNIAVGLLKGMGINPNC